MDPASFLQGRTRETTIRRDALGRWFHDGEPLEHQNLTRAFDRWLDRADDGRYCLKNDINWAYITLEGPPLFVRKAEVTSAGQVKLSLSDDSEPLLDPGTLREDADGALYCDVLRPNGSFVARFERFAMQQLEDALGEDAQGVFLTVAGKKLRPPKVSDPLVPVLPFTALGGQNQDGSAKP